MQTRQDCDEHGLLNSLYIQHKNSTPPMQVYFVNHLSCADYCACVRPQTDNVKEAYCNVKEAYYNVKNKTSQIAMNMVERWGMSDKLGFVAHKHLTGSGRNGAGLL